MFQFQCPLTRDFAGTRNELFAPFPRFTVEVYFTLSVYLSVRDLLSVYNLFRSMYNVYNVSLGLSIYLGKWESVHNVCRQSAQAPELWSYWYLESRDPAVLQAKKFLWLSPKDSNVHTDFRDLIDLPHHILKSKYFYF